MRFTSYLHVSTGVVALAIALSTVSWEPAHATSEPDTLGVDPMLSAPPAKGARAGFLIAQVEGPGQYDQPAAADSDFYPASIPVTLDGATLGLVDAQVTLSGYTRLNAKDLSTILTGRLSPGQEALLLSYGNRAVLLEELRRDGLLAIYDPSVEIIKITLRKSSIPNTIARPTPRPAIRRPDDDVFNVEPAPVPVPAPLEEPNIIVPDSDGVLESESRVPKSAAPTQNPEDIDIDKASSKDETEKSAQVQKSDEPREPPAVDEEYFPLEVPLLVNGALVGDVTAEATITGYAKVSAARILELLAERLAEDQIAILSAYGDAQATLEQLNADGFRFEYDSGEIVLNMTLALSGVQEVSKSARSLDTINLNDFEKPAGFSAGASLIARPRYVHRSPNGEPGFAPLAADVRGFVSAGGFNNWSLVYELDALEGRDQLVRRGEVTLIHDDFRTALRFQAGDIRPSITGFQSGFNMLGVGVERNYGTIQPFRNLRPGGRTTFTLERTSNVTYEVNGVIIGNDRLEPGDYDIRDLPLITGSNDVRVIVDDEFGTREVGAYSTFVDTELLSAKTLIFGANVGVRREAGFSGFSPNYGNDLLGTAFIEKGVSDNLTLGAQTEASSDGGFVGTRAVFGFGSNLLAAEAGFSAFDQLDTGYSAALRYTRRPFRETGKIYNQFDAQISYRSDDFKTIGNVGAPRGESWQVAARNNMTVDKYTINANGNWLKTDFDEITTVGTSVSTYIKNVNVSVGYQGVHSKFADDLDNRFFVTLSKNFGKYGTVRSRTASGPYETELEWRRLSTRGVGALSGRASYLTGEAGDEFTADASYIASRAEFDLAHRSTFENGFGRNDSAVTDARIGVGLGFADGALALGRPVTDGFFILRAHPSLEGRTIETSQGADRLSGKTDFLGPAIVPLSGAYREQTHRIKVEDLPPGYDIGSSQIKVFPSSFTGYKIRVGTDPAALVIGNLKNTDDTPVALAVGKLVPLDKPDVESIDFFTNRTGRFVAERVPAGRYNLVLMPNEKVITELDIGEGVDGVVKVETIIVKEK